MNRGKKNISWKHFICKKTIAREGKKSSWNHFSKKKKKWFNWEEKRKNFGKSEHKLREKFREIVFQIDFTFFSNRSIFSPRYYFTWKNTIYSAFCSFCADFTLFTYFTHFILLFLVWPILVTRRNVWSLVPIDSNFPLVFNHKYRVTQIKIYFFN